MRARLRNDFGDKRRAATVGPPVILPSASIVAACDGITPELTLGARRILRYAPMYFAWTVRATDTSSVPLMMARASGKTVIW